VACLGSKNSAIELYPPGPEGWTSVPKGMSPRDRLKQACLATGHHTEVSALSSRGNRCIPYPGHYSPAFAFSAILYPQQMHLILQPDLLRLAARLCFGLTLFRAMSTDREDSPPICR
jgi:hypothetical protein